MQCFTRAAICSQGDHKLLRCSLSFVARRKVTCCNITEDAHDKCYGMLRSPLGMNAQHAVCMKRLAKDTLPKTHVPTLRIVHPSHAVAAQCNYVHKAVALHPLKAKLRLYHNAAFEVWHLRWNWIHLINVCLLYTSPSPRDRNVSRMPSSA